MDHSKAYCNLVSTRLAIKDKRLLLKSGGEYFERHHILPKCKGGSNSQDNIVLFTAREHFIAHWLLWLMYRDRQMALAFHKMLSTTKLQKRIVSSRGYEEARDAFRLTNIGNTYGKKNKGTLVRTVDHCASISKAKIGKCTGDENPFFGKSHTAASRKLISDKAKLRLDEAMHSYKGRKAVVKDGQIKGIFKSSKEVAEFIGCSASNVRHVLAGHQKKANGFEIKYVNTK